jgi:AcrR family transcriptional regulator
LTFEELAKVSGVTRGGITYHFPTKDALLRGLLDEDMAQWKSSEAELTAKNCECPRLTDLLGFIRSHTSQDDDRRRFVAGMLSAAVHQPELLEGCREEMRERYGSETWDEASLRAYLLRMAAVGMFWDDVFQFQHMPAQARSDLVALLERLAAEWTANDEHAA